MMPSCRKSSAIRTATETREGSAPRRPAEIRSTTRSAGTTTTGVFVYLQDWVKGGSGGGGGGGCWQLATNTVMNATSATRFKHAIRQPRFRQTKSFKQRFPRVNQSV